MLHVKEFDEAGSSCIGKQTAIKHGTAKDSTLSRAFGYYAQERIISSARGLRFATG